ncbi:uncharacterized protein F5891DRAFT_1058404 [Suillus fuscotomentosus]|uniref:Uncharacterized protein n=1 Tax=Suillus fuscotomentosus TaxID=1912939 RepID=A0AAD4DWG9_9AGAM|nr:uncharacterized protein F5891DRAFT_1058404 [Suillus fuscotomentosus]KAG1895433.1 hypothetical protein F5891DRAFT_1058404 [Suillus fuscotomentosus]
MSHPRYSVLNLFDPLNATPRSEVTTPDSLSGSDKENAEPSHESYYESDRLTMTAFFNRTYKTQSKHYSPVVLRTRLVDVGDTTIMDETADLLNGLTIEEEPEDDVDNASLVHESMDMDEEDSLATPMNSPSRKTHNRYNSTQTPLSEQTLTPHVQRTPLADISMDATPVPRKAVNLARASPEASNSGAEHHSSPMTAVRTSHATLAPVSSPLASVINAINFTDKKVPSGGRIHEHATPTIVVSREGNLGSPTVHLSPSPSATLLSEEILTRSDAPLLPPSKYQTQSSPSHDALTASTARPRLRARAHTTSSPSFNPRRNSVDLQSSFNLQLNCPDASFDLLNDRISFFGGDAFVIDTDDFDMQAEEEMMEALANRIKEKDAASTVATDAGSPAPQFGSSPTLQPSPPAAAANAPPVAVRLTTRRSSLSPGMKLSSPSPRPPMVVAPEAEVSEPLKVSAPLSPIPSPTLQSVTPPRVSLAFTAPVPAAPVHALRIVKRSKAHDRTTSLSSAGSSAGSSAEEQESPTVPSASIHKPILTGVRRPPPGLMPADLKANVFCKPEQGIRPTLGMKNKLTSVLGLRTKATEPPHSPLEMCMPSQPVQTKPSSGTLKSRLLKPTASSLSKAPPVKIPTASNTTATSKSLRPPSRFATIGMASGLPRPTGGALPSSRLPAPTISAPKSKLPSMTGSSSTIGRSATIRRV